MRFPCFFGAFLVSFPRISSVLPRGRSLLFSGDPRFSFAKKSKDWRVRVFRGEEDRKTVQIVKNYSGNKNTMASSAILLLVRKGPFGKALKLCLKSRGAGKKIF